VHLIARAGGGRPYPIYAPMWVEDQGPSKACEASGPSRKRLPCIIRLMSSWSASDPCTLQNRVCARRFLRPGMIRPSRPASGRTCARPLLDDEGRAVANPLDQLGLGITPSSSAHSGYRRNWGRTRKAAAIASVLRGGWIAPLSLTLAWLGAYSPNACSTALNSREIPGLHDLLANRRLDHSLHVLCRSPTQMLCLRMNVCFAQHRTFPQRRDRP